MKIAENSIYYAIIIVGAILLSYGILSASKTSTSGIPGLDKPLNLTGVSCAQLEEELKLQHLPAGMKCSCTPGALAKDTIEVPEGVEPGKITLGYVLSCEFEGQSLIYPIWIAANQTNTTIP